MMNTKRTFPTLGLTLALALAFGWTAPRAQADELSEKGQAIFKQHQHAVVTVEVVLKSKISMAGRDSQASEARQDLTGTVVSPDGLTVVSLSALDPTQLLQGMEENRVKVETELSDLKILLDDGTELSSEVVLRDKDLDLAFVRPKSKPATPMAALDLTQTGKADLLDQVLSLNRLGNAAGRAYAASAERISAIVRKPRLFYIPETSMTTTAMGAPALTLDGKLLGLFVMRVTKSKSNAGAFGPRADNFTAIIIPAEDILKAAKQVPAASAQQPNPQEKKETQKKDQAKQ